MVYDLLERAKQYEGLGPLFMKGLRYLSTTDLAALPEGRYEIDGARLFALIQHYSTRPANPTPEAHRAYIDIQYLFEGEELVAVAPLEEMGEIAQAHPERDIWLYHGGGEALTLGRGRFLALWPGDAHAPCIAAGGRSAPVKKCVIKVKL